MNEGERTKGESTKGIGAGNCSVPTQRNVPETLPQAIFEHFPGRAEWNGVNELHIVRDPPARHLAFKKL